MAKSKQRNTMLLHLKHIGEKHLSNMREEGFSVQYVLPNEDNARFGYTIGLSLASNRPEIVMVGFGPKLTKLGAQAPGFIHTVSE